MKDCEISAAWLIRFLRVLPPNQTFMVFNKDCVEIPELFGKKAPKVASAEKPDSICSKPK